MWAKIKINRYNDDVIYLKRNNMFPIANKTIIKVDAVDDDSNDYRNRTGVHFMDEDTLILGDNDNNVYLVFISGNEAITAKSITRRVHVINRYNYDLGSIIHKKHDITPIPVHLRPLIINNTVTNITSNIQSLNISNNNMQDSNIQNKNTARISFLDNNYMKGGMYPLVDMKRHPEWIPEYRKHVEVKRLNICKSCRKRFIKGCCSEYNSHNKTMQTMVIGWHK